MFVVEVIALLDIAKRRSAGHQTLVQLYVTTALMRGGATTVELDHQSSEPGLTLEVKTQLPHMHAHATSIRDRLCSTPTHNSLS
jgi:hypothetical protein